MVGGVMRFERAVCGGTGRPITRLITIEALADGKAVPRGEPLCCALPLTPPIQ